jgi:hypothetical protein
MERRAWRREKVQSAAWTESQAAHALQQRVRRKGRQVSLPGLLTEAQPVRRFGPVQGPGPQAERQLALAQPEHLQACERLWRQLP